MSANAASVANAAKSEPAVVLRLDRRSGRGVSYEMVK